MQVTGYITDGHEAANFELALAFFVLAWIVGGISYTWRADHAARGQGLATIGLLIGGVLGICGCAMAVVWLTRSNLIYSDSPPTTAAETGTGSGALSTGSDSQASLGNFCSTQTCDGDFYNEPGYIVLCGDGSYSHAGGLQGACSHHDGEASGPIALNSDGTIAGSTTTPETTVPPTTTDSATTSEPPLPTYQPPSPPPASTPRLTGATSAASGGFSFTVKRLVAQKDLDRAGPPATFAVGVIASCSQPDTSITTWNLSSGGHSYDSGIASCLQGSVNPEGMPVTVTVTGCGAHTLAVTPMGYGSKVDGTMRPQAPPMRFPFMVCP